jgi:hypothetical protein
LKKCFERTSKKDKRIDEYFYSSGESDHSEQKFRMKTIDEQDQIVLAKWKICIRKLVVAVRMLTVFGDLNSEIYIHGATSEHVNLFAEEIPKPFFFVLLPNDLLRIVWNFVIFFLLIYTATYVPYVTAFINSDSDSMMTQIELGIDSLFIADLFINFISAYEDVNFNVEVRLKFIAIRYIRSWFFLDLTSSIPFQLIN